MRVFVNNCTFYSPGFTLYQAVRVVWELPPVPEQDDNTGWRFHCQIRRLSIRYKKGGPNGRK